MVWRLKPKSHSKERKYKKTPTIAQSIINNFTGDSRRFRAAKEASEIKDKKALFIKEARGTLQWLKR